MARTAKRQAAAAPPAQPISDYARVSKSQIQSQARLPGAAVKKAAVAVVAAAATRDSQAAIKAIKAATVTTRKRKATAREEEEEEEEEGKFEGAAVAPTVDDKKGKGDKEDKEGKEEDKENRPSKGRARRTVAAKPRSSRQEPQTPAKRARRTEPTKAKAPITSTAADKRVPVEAPIEAQAPTETPVETPTQTPTPKPTPRKAAKTTPAEAQPTPAKASTRQSKLEDFRYTSRKADNGADLVRLHSAFLKTVLLHVAHNGRAAPIDIAAIAPNISRNWGKRQVTVDDIRRCVALEAASPFFVCDYGRGRVCVELKREWVRGNAAIDEARLCAEFEDGVRRICAERARAGDQARDGAVLLEDMALADLPRAEVVDGDAGVAANPLLAKGHRALSELKSELAEKQQAAKEAKKQQATKEAQKQQTAKEPAPDAAGQKMSLLDRIRHKQLAKANDPLPPSATELRRRAALNRVADVAATVSMFSLANESATPRQAFTMALVSDKLRDSLRVPISADEGVACIRLIAGEIAPEWIKIVTVGGRENVVIQRDNQPVDRILQDRVQKLLG